MSNFEHRVEVTADAILDSVYGQELPEDADHISRAALAASDAELRSAEAVERVAQAIYLANMEKWLDPSNPWGSSYEKRSKSSYVEQAEAAIAALLD